MVNRLMTEEQVKEYLGIPDFRHASKDVLVRFVSSIPYINKDVAIKIIEQYPAYCTCAQAFVQHYSALCDKLLIDNSKSVEAAMKGYQTTLDTISELAKMENITADERHRYAETMVFIADKMAALDAENKRYHEEMARTYRYVIGICIFIGATILGVNIKGVKIPRL